jgi:hypothetical protein
MELLATQLASASIDEARDGNSLQIVDFPVVPQKKSKPRPLVFAGAGLVFRDRPRAAGVVVARGAVSRDSKGE